MKRIYTAVLVLAVLMLTVVGFAQQKATVKNASFYDYSMTSLAGETLDLAQFQGKVVLVVNVASECGFTPQYEGLQSLYDEYKDQGLVVIGFPTNEFGDKEPGTNAEIERFCSVNYSVSFPMSEKTYVVGDDQNPIFQYLTNEEANPEFGGEVTWNFNKFLVGPDGKVINRFESDEEPKSDKIVSAIQSALSSV